MATPRRSTSSNSFTLNVAPEPLFHDEEIAFSGVNIHNPLWDRGTSFSSSWRDDGDEDLLLPPPTSLFSVARKVLPPMKQQSPQRSTKSTSSAELVINFAAGMTIICIFAGIVALSLTQSNEVWASSGLIVADDDAIVDRGMITARDFDCPRTMTGDATDAGASFIRFKNQNASLCEKEVRGL
jgi:hypothetical protein